MKIIKIFIVFFLFFSSDLIAQGTVISGSSGCFQLVTGKVKNEVTNVIISNATVELYAQNRLIQTKQTNSKGIARFKVGCDASYQLVAYKGNLSKTKKEFVTSDAGNINVEFALLIEEPEQCTITLEGLVKNDEDEFMNESVIIIYDKGKEIKRTIVKRDGKYRILLECNKPYKIVVQSVNHIEYTYVQNTGTKNNKSFEKNFTLEKLACIKNLYGSLTDTKTNKKIISGNVKLLLNGKFVQNTRTNDQGEFSFKVKCNANYSVSASKTEYESAVFRVAEIKYGQDDYFLNMPLNPIPKKEIVEEKKQVEITPTIVKEIEEKIEVIPTIENEIVEEKKPTPKLLEVGEIEFDLNESKITRNIGIELDKIIYLMKVKPEIKVLLKSHTDSRGPDVYNINLTEARAQSMVNYIVNNGIDSSRISGKGYGETELINDCSNGEKCRESEHQKNRRNEFIVTNE